MNPTISGAAQLARDIGLAFLVLAALGFFYRTSEDLRAIRELLEKRAKEKTGDRDPSDRSRR